MAVGQREARVHAGAGGDGPGRRQLPPVGQHLAAERVVLLLRALHHVVNRPEPLDRVVDLHRQRGEEVRHAVGEHGLPGRAGADRHARDQRPVGERVVLEQPAAERAGGEREDDVVDGDVERVLHRLDVVERKRRRDERAASSERPVERQVGCGERRRGRHRAGASAAGDVADALVGAAQQARDPEQLAQPFEQRPPEQLAPGRGRVRVATASLGGGGSGASMSGVKTLTSSSAAFTPSATEWWILATKPTWPSSSPSTTQTSQSGRLRSSGTPAMSGDELVEAPAVAGRRDRRPPEVVLEAEVGVLHPHRVVHAEGHLDHPPPERRQQVEALVE